MTDHRHLLNALNQAKNEGIYTNISFVCDTASEFSRLCQMLGEDPHPTPNGRGQYVCRTRPGSSTSIYATVQINTSRYHATSEDAEAEVGEHIDRPDLSSRWDVV